MNINACVYGWGGCVVWVVLEEYEWIGKRGEEDLHHYILFVSLKENNSLD